MNGWDDRETPAYYEAFCRGHSRYRRANAALISHARIQSPMRVLDLAAGTGRTAEAALERLGEDGRVICVEPSVAMRAEGMRRVTDRRVHWRASLHEAEGPFDRILCGAAIWQLGPLPETLSLLAGFLRPGGGLVFNMPALYLLEPDEPGGGSDPLLLSLPAMLWVAPDSGSIHATPETQTGPELRPASIRQCLRAAGLRARSWTFRLRLSQEGYAAWLKIPVLTNRMLPGLTPAERARRIDAALESVDRSSWKWERWRGWTAWKPQAGASTRE
jgi:SAM-dependent methyltransferase